MLFILDSSDGIPIIIAMSKRELEFCVEIIILIYLFTRMHLFPKTQIAALVVPAQLRRLGVLQITMLPIKHTAQMPLK